MEDEFKDGTSTCDYILMLSDDLDIERRTNRHGPYFCFTRYRYGLDDVRRISVSYKYIEQVAKLKDEVTECLKKSKEKRFKIERCRHGLAVRLFQGSYYVFVPYIIEQPSVVDFLRSLNMNPLEWQNFVSGLDTLLLSQAEFVRRKRSRSLPPGGRWCAAPVPSEAERETDSE